MVRATKNILPGDKKKESLESMMRVDHAGEYGAKCIYEGQLAALRSLGHADNQEETQKFYRLIEEMYEEEVRHLRYFQDILDRRKMSRSVLCPLWHFCGYGLGFVTAKLGNHAAMACTTAIEDVIDQHYQSQVDCLEQHYSEEEELVESIKQFRLEEINHRDIGIEHGAENMPGYSVFYRLLQVMSKLAISLSKAI